MKLNHSSAFIQRQYVKYIRNPWWIINDRHDVNHIFLRRINNDLQFLIREERIFRRQTRIQNATLTEK